jgi:hypothetical protein
MTWIVLGEKNGRIQLVSKGDVKGLLPKGSYLTIEEGKTKFILRVDDSQQSEPYSPSPMIIDMDLKPLEQDQKCQNIINAYRVKDITNRQDGLIDYIKPQSKARRSNQEEIDLAMSGDTEGPKVFLATVHSSQNQLLIDEKEKYITTKLPKDMFFHQMLICGKTGSGKTVATKYLTQYFVEELGGAVLAINVKDVDFLKMDLPSNTKNSNILKEWKSLDNKAHGIQNFVIYHPASDNICSSKGIDPNMAKAITLNVTTIDPNALIGLLNRVSDLGAQNLPNIFRSWQESRKQEGSKEDFTFGNFVNYFSNGEADQLTFRTLNTRGDEGEIRLHRGTFENIRRALDSAIEFFDNKSAECLDETDILQVGKMSVIDVAVRNGSQFGSILLRHLLHKIVNAKVEKTSNVPILIIIDEVHQFYNSDASYEALGDLDTICRTGRSQEIGVIFSSQNPSDIPRGLSSVINTKLFFKSDASLAKSHGITISYQEMESLKKGFAAASIHELPQAKIVKFPLSYCGVFE